MFNNILDTYVISDTHFYHKNVIRYVGRPWCTNTATHMRDVECPYCDVEKMNDDIISNWNSVVSDKDTVLHLGDYCFGNKVMVEDITNRLNGNIYLIRGNHDRRTKTLYENCGITMVKPFYAEYDIGKRFLFGHKPITIMSKDVIPVFGHWHNKSPFTWYMDGMTYFNVSVEAIDYKPMKLGKILSIYESLQVEQNLI